MSDPASPATTPPPKVPRKLPRKSPVPAPAEAADGAATAAAASASGALSPEDEVKAILKAKEPAMLPKADAMIKVFEKKPGGVPGFVALLRKKHGIEGPFVPSADDAAAGDAPSGAAAAAAASPPAKAAPPVPKNRPSPRPDALAGGPASSVTPTTSSLSANAAAPLMSQEDEVRAILRAKEPNMLPRADQMISVFREKPGGVASFVNMLRKKHGIVGPFNPDAAAAPPANNAAPPVPATRPTTAKSPVPTASATSPSPAVPAPPAGGGGGDYQQLISDVLATHNALRAKHGAAPLTWSAECAQFAAKCAAESTRNKQMTHGNADGPSGAHGQNIYSSEPAPTVASVGKAVQMWYDECVRPGYDFTKDGGGQKGTGHFTQVVWAATKQVGCAIVGNFLVCNYFPAGNYSNKYLDNVKPPAAVPSSSRQPLAPEDEVRAILQRFEPNVAPKADEMMARFKAKPGGVGAFLIMLRKKHALESPFHPDDPRPGAAAAAGATSPPPAGATLSAADSELDLLVPLPPAPGPSAPVDKPYWRARLHNFYVKYDRTRLSMLDQIIAEYESDGNTKFEQMFRFLVSKKYGPEPVAPTAEQAAARAAARAAAAATSAAHSEEIDFGADDSHGFNDSLTPHTAAAATTTTVPATSTQERSLPPPPEHNTALQHFRLKRMYAKYDLSKVPTAGAILAKYGQDVEGVRDLFASMVQKYGPEPDVTEATPIHDRCINMYLYYDPQEILNFHRHLDIFKKEQQNLTGGKATNKLKEAESLLAQLQNKYGPEPTAKQMDEINERIKLEHRPDDNGIVVANLNAVTLRCYRMLKHYDRPRLAQFAAEQKKYAGREHDWLAMLIKTYGPEPEERKSKEERAAEAQRMQEIERAERGRSEFEVRARNMLQKYDPKQLQDGTFDALVERYGGGAKGAEKLLRDLVTRYGEEPDLREMDDKEHLQQRAMNVVHAYDPAAAAQLPALLQRFAGREEVLVRSLVRRYGPEPLDRLGEPLSSSTSRGGGGAAIPPTLGENIAEIQRLIRQHEPESLAAAPGLLKRYAGKEELLVQLLQQRYGVSVGIEMTDPGEAQKPDPRISGSVADTQNQIRAILAKHQPAALEKLADLMKEHAGREKQLLDDLVAKHGPVTDDMLKAVAATDKLPLDLQQQQQQQQKAADAAATFTTTNRVPLHPQEGKYRQKLVAFFTHYDRLELPRVDEWFEKFPGRPEAMLEAVHKKYTVPPPREVPEWMASLQTLCLQHGHDELFLERLIAAMGGSNASKENVTFELLSIWYPDFVQSVMTDEGQRRTLTAKRLARFLSVMAPGRVAAIPDMLAQVANDQDSTLVLGDMLLTFFKDAVQAAAIPRLDHAALRISERDHGPGVAAVGSGFIGTVERLQKMLDVWKTQRHHIRTPVRLGDAALDLIRLSKVQTRAAGSDELIDKPVRSLGTDTELDVESMFGSATPAGGRTLEHGGKLGGSNNNNNNNHSHDNAMSSPPNPLLFSRFGIDSDTIPRTRWGCPNCTELKNYVTGTESRWQQQLRDAEVKIWKLMEQNAKLEALPKTPMPATTTAASAASSNTTTTATTAAADDSSVSAGGAADACRQCNTLRKEIEHLRGRVHQLSCNVDTHQKQQAQLSAAAQQSGIRQLFQREYPSPAAAQASRMAAVNVIVANNNNINNNNSAASAARAAAPVTTSGDRTFAFYNSSSARPLSHISPALQRSAELWSSLYTQAGAGTSGHSVAAPEHVAAGITKPTSEEANKVLSFL